MAGLAVVTGVSRGLGNALLLALSQAGWTVVGVSRSVVTNAPRGTRLVLGDLRDPATALRFLDALGDARLDLLVNNAGAGSRQHTLATIDDDQLSAAFDTNVLAPVRLCRSVLPNLLAAPQPLVLNISSRLGSTALQARGDFKDFDTSYAYRVSKAALNMLTISIANELGERLRCWSVHPGSLATSTGRPGAEKRPELAAAQILELVTSRDNTPLRFCSLGEPDLPW